MAINKDGGQLTDEGRQKRAEYLRQWRKRNPERCRAYAEKYWSRKATAHVAGGSVNTISNGCQDKNYR